MKSSQDKVNKLVLCGGKYFWGKHEGARFFTKTSNKMSWLEFTCIKNGHRRLYVSSDLISWMICKSLFINAISNSAADYNCQIIGKTRK